MCPECRSNRLELQTSRRRKISRWYRFQCGCSRLQFRALALHTNPYHYASQVFEYYEAMFGGFDDASMITEVKKVDDFNVQFTLSAPLAPFIANLAMDIF